MSTYQAFISYSHTADGSFAPALQRGLQQLGRSWRARRAMDVFRDETGLSVDPDLWGAISTALDASDWFVLLASPQAAASHWVGQEIEHCIATKGSRRILIVLTEGTLKWDPDVGDFTADSDAAHPSLRGLLDEEPAIVDLSWARQETDLTLDNARFRADIARIAAVIRDVPLQTIVDQDTRERRRAKTIVRSALGVLTAAAAVTVVAAVVAGVSWGTAAAEQSVAEEEERIALARELSAQSRTTDDPRAALALAVESYRLAPEDDAAGAMLTAVAGVGAGLTELPALLPDEFSAADIRSSSDSADGTTGRIALASGGGTVVADVSTAERWQLSGQAPHHLTPDGERAIGTDGTIVELLPDGEVAEIARVPALSTPPSFADDGETFVYRHDSATGAELTVADTSGAGVLSTAVSLGSDCAGCEGDASTFAISPDGSHVAARVAPAWAPTSVRAVVRTYAVDADELRELASSDVGGTGTVRFADDSHTIWARDDAALVVVDPATLEPVAEAMSVDRAGPLLFHDDTRALAPVDDCALPGVVTAPTMATVADLPAEIEFTEAGCIDASPPGSEPRWVLGDTWIRTSLGLWPADPDALVEIACAALGGPVTEQEFEEFTDAPHTPTACTDEDGGQS